MLLITKHIGQLCNQIWSLLPIIAYAEHTQSKVCILNAREDYVNLFPALLKYKRVWWVHQCNGEVGKLWRWVTRLVEKHTHSYEGILNGPCSGIRQINGWEYSHDASFIKESKQTLLQLFTPEGEVLKKIEDVLDGYRGITVGIHVRRGDYREWCGGAYCYSDNVWIRIMRGLAREAKKQHQDIRFLICSNEPVSMNDPELTLLQIPNTDGVTDLYGLAKCDYIIGPPSTYAQWASFYGDVPLCIILQPNQKISFNDFVPIDLLDRFKNGKKMVENIKTKRFYFKAE